MSEEAASETPALPDERWLRATWESAWRQLPAADTDPAAAPDALFDALLAAYIGPDRYYHDLRHIAACLSQFAGVTEFAARPAEIVLAIWFHDAVYDTHAADNEERSAANAADAIGGPAGQRVRDLVLATKHGAAAPDGDAALLADIDLAILAAEPAAFWRYEAAIRSEYAWVPETVFRAGRAAILAGFLERDAIYRTPILRDRCEAAARANLAASLARLRAAPAYNSP
jgi:predicted metal-dependent HD superfamily phosphohydrolase